MMPGSAYFRHFGEQGGQLFVWVEVRTDLPSINHTYVVVGTGHEVPTFGEWKGTYFSGSFVWHLYELIF